MLQSQWIIVISVVEEFTGRSSPIGVKLTSRGCSDTDLDNKEYPQIESALARFDTYNVYTMYKRVRWTSVRRPWDPRYRATRLNVRFLLVPDFNWQLATILVRNDRCRRKNKQAAFDSPLLLLERCYCLLSGMIIFQPCFPSHLESLDILEIRKIVTVSAELLFSIATLNSARYAVKAQTRMYMYLTDTYHFVNSNFGIATFTWCKRTWLQITRHSFHFCYVCAVWE